MSASPSGTVKLPAGLVEAARTELAERRLHAFIRQAWPVVEPARPFVDGRHIGAVCEHLEAVTAGQIRRLIINVPPGFMKSLAVCVFWFCWVWLRQPASRWLYTSYSEGFALRDSNKCRDVIKSDWYRRRWGDRFRLTADAAGKFSNNRTGFRLATSVQGGGTGERVDYAVGDDLLKIEDAGSVAAREAVNHHWDHVIAGRGTDLATYRQVLIMQRLHEQDLTGHLLEQGGYEHLFVPMEYEPARRCATSIWQDWRTQEGELAWPERFPQPVVADWKKRLLGYGTASQLQQKPEPIAEGAIYNRLNFRTFTEERAAEGDWWFLLHREADRPAERVDARACRWFQTVDTALKTNQDNDYTAVGTFGVTPQHDLLVYDVARDRVPVPLQFQYVVGMRQRFPQVLYQAVEDSAGGIGVLQQGLLTGHQFRSLKVPGDKVTKAAEAATAYQNHKVFHRAGSPWLADFEHELAVFPKGAHDDMQDCVAYAAILVRTDQLLYAASTTDGPLTMWPPAAGDWETRQAVEEAMTGGEGYQPPPERVVADPEEVRPWMAKPTPEEVFERDPEWWERPAGR